MWIFRGKVTAFHVSVEGGYITTNKSNLVIALSPYFVPFWSVVLAVIYGLARIFAEPNPAWDLAFYAAMGLTWTFHMVWTLWMIPRDQPDLRENGIFLSLVAPGLPVGGDGKLECRARSAATGSGESLVARGRSACGVIRWQMLDLCHRPEG